MWAEENWIELARQLQGKGYFVLLLGGKDEHEKNQRIAKLSGASYFGHFPLKQFIHEVNQCDLVVTAVTMAMHLVIGLDKKLILFNNTFNKNEFELYGRGIILEPQLECLGCFKTYFDDNCKANNCMDLITPEQVQDAILSLL